MAGLRADGYGQAFSFGTHDDCRIRFRDVDAVHRMVTASAERVADHRSSSLSGQFAAISDTQRADVGIDRPDIRTVVTGVMAGGGLLSPKPH